MIYEAQKVLEIEDQLQPDVPGIENVEWRWVAQAPYFYFETRMPLPKDVAVRAPKCYPNGVEIDSGDRIAEWHKGKLEEVDPLPGVPTEDIEKALRLRGLSSG